MGWVEYIVQFWLCIQSSRFSIVFYKVTMKAELMHTEQLLIGKYRVSLLWAPMANIFISWSTHGPFLYMLLFKDALLNIYCSFIIFEHRANSIIAHCLSEAYHVCLPPTTYLLHKDRHSLLSPTNTDKHFSTTLWNHFKQWNHHQKHKNMTLNRSQRTLIPMVSGNELKQEGRE